MKRIFLYKFFIFSILLSILFNFFIIETKATEKKITKDIYSLSSMLNIVLPSVVNIYVSGYQIIKIKNIKLSDIYRYKNLNNSLILKKFSGLGSGVIIDSKRGYVITNNHIIEDTNFIKIKLNDNREFLAKVISSDKKIDLALLKLSKYSNLTAIKISKSNKYKIGDFVVAIGNPFGIGQSSTFGIISSNINLGKNEYFIQTDAPINKGNSGGALINLKGELIGINTAILSPNSYNIGIGLAIPADIIKNTIQKFIKKNKIKNLKLGINGISITSDITNVFDIKIKNGLFVSKILLKSLANKIGIKTCDVIIKIENKIINNFNDLMFQINNLCFTKKNINLYILRNNKIKIISIVLS